MMTTMCALLSGLPLMLGHGAGSELRRPLGYAMVGGLLVSQAMTLFTTPVIYLYLDRAHTWYMRTVHPMLLARYLANDDDLAYILGSRVCRDTKNRNHKFQFRHQLRIPE